MEKKKIYVVACRHGERADFEGKLGKYSWEDPELTDRGIDQANNVGKQLQEFIINNGIDQVVIESSPFLRTLETSCSLLSQINSELHHNKIYVNNSLSEFNRLFLINPTHKLCYNMQNEEALQFLKKNNIEIEELEKPPIFPESHENGIKRAQKYILNLKSKLENFDCKCLLYIIVSHGYNIQVFCESLDPDMEIFEIEFCWSFLFKLDSKKGRFKLNEIIKPQYE